ncbi:hypothetical protein TruAng_003760 [Truncatella angustata]|nr:hypothetical protein TruAng_003760 [Truncatella angustata]
MFSFNDVKRGQEKRTGGIEIADATLFRRYIIRMCDASYDGELSGLGTHDEGQVHLPDEEEEEYSSSTKAYEMRKLASKCYVFVEATGHSDVHANGYIPKDHFIGNGSLLTMT